MNFEQQEWIDSYLFGELEGEELLRFEAKMQEETNFREDVRLQKDMLSGIHSYFAAKPEVIKPRSDSKLVWIRRSLRVAAAIVLIVAVSAVFSPHISLYASDVSAEKLPKISYPGSTTVALHDAYAQYGVPAFKAIELIEPFEAWLGSIARGFS